MFLSPIDALKNYPTLKIDFGKCPSQYDLTDELAIYKAVEIHMQKTENINKYQCQTCGMNFSNQDYAILHQFLDHATTFLANLELWKIQGSTYVAKIVNLLLFQKVFICLILDIAMTSSEK